MVKISVSFHRKNKVGIKYMVWNLGEMWDQRHQTKRKR